MADREPWFGRKRFGGGVGPRTWQGWLVCGGVFAALIAARFLVVAYYAHH